MPLNRVITDFDNGQVYFYVVYRQGSTFFQAVREAMGAEAYWKALRTYRDQHTGGIARPQELLRAFQSAAPSVDLRPVFRQFLDYPFLQYRTLALAIGGPADDVWTGVKAVPISVTADSPTYTLSVLLDGAVISRTHWSCSCGC